MAGPATFWGPPLGAGDAAFLEGDFTLRAADLCGGDVTLLAGDVGCLAALMSFGLGCSASVEATCCDVAISAAGGWPLLTGLGGAPVGGAGSLDCTTLGALVGTVVTIGKDGGPGAAPE